MFPARFTNVLTLCSVLSICVSYSFASAKKANDFEKNYEKLDVEAIVDLFKKGGLPTESLENNPVDYVPTKLRTIITAGQGRDSDGQITQPSIYPFVVGQKAIDNVDASESLTDRFDVLEDKHGNEFFALYDGGVKRVKGLLLVEVANAVKDLLPLLDKVTHPSIRTQEKVEVIESAVKQAEMFQKEIEKLIRGVFAKVDQEVQSKNPKEHCAAASVVIVTKYNLIVAWLGNVRVLTYDEAGNTKRLTNDHSSDNKEEVSLHYSKGFDLCPIRCWFRACYMTRSFASSYNRDEKYHDTEPEIKFVPRYFFDRSNNMMSTQFVVLEAFGIAMGLEDTEVTGSITRAVESSKKTPEAMNSMYVAMVDNIYDMPLKERVRVRLTNDFNLLVIGLEKDN